MPPLKKLMSTGFDVVLNRHNQAADAELVANFIAREGPAIHPGFREPSHFDKQRAVYTLPAWHQYVVQILPKKRSC